MSNQNAPNGIVFDPAIAQPAGLPDFGVTNWQDLYAICQRRTLELLSGQHPAMNMMPTFDLVKAALLAGYDLTPMTPETLARLRRGTSPTPPSPTDVFHLAGPTELPHPPGTPDRTP